MGQCDDFTEDDKKVCCVWSSCCGLVGGIFIIFAFALSFNIVEYNETALVENTFYPKIDYYLAYDKPGYYWVGWDQRLITFKTYKQLVEFSGANTVAETPTDSGAINAGQIAGWTSEGVNIFIDMNFYYTLNRARILDMYKNYGAQWKNNLIRISFGLIKGATVNYSVTNYFENRVAISAAFKDALNVGLNTYMMGAITVTDLNLRKIAFEEVFETAINKKQIQAHLKKSYQNQQSIQQTNKNTDYIVAGLSNQIKIQHNTAYATGNQTLATTDNAALSTLIQTFNTYYGSMMSTFAITNQQIMPYIYSIEFNFLGATMRSKTVQTTVDSNAKTRANVADL